MADDDDNIQSTPTKQSTEKVRHYGIAQWIRHYRIVG